MTDDMAVTLEDLFSDSKDLEISFKSLHYQEFNTLKNNDVIILLGESILNKYRGDLEEIAYEKKLTNDEIKKWHYNPMVMSYDLYGTTEFWHLLLDLNNVSSMIEFDLNPMKVYDASITELIENIINMEEDSIALNNEEIENALL